MCAMRPISKSSTSSTSSFRVNSRADSGSSTPILSYRPPTSSPLHIVSTANIIPLSSLNMKDTSASSRHSRNNPLYPKRRPSPHGVTKFRKSQSPLTLSVVAVAAAASRRSPRVAKMESVLQRRRELQLAALRREGVLLEDEYREDIRYYMYEMEVRRPYFKSSYISHQLGHFFRGSQWELHHQWTSNQKSSGTCAPASSSFSSSSILPSACALRHYISP